MSKKQQSVFVLMLRDASKPSTGALMRAHQRYNVRPPDALRLCSDGAATPDPTLDPVGYTKGEGKKLLETLAAATEEATRPLEPEPEDLPAQEAAAAEIEAETVSATVAETKEA